MKNDVVAKINKIGKVGQIICRIGKVVLIIPFVVSVFTVMILAAIPQNLVTIDMSHQAAFHVDLNKLQVMNVIEHMEPTITDDMDISASIVLNGTDYNVVDFEQRDNELKILADAETYTLDLWNMLWILISTVLSIVAIYIVLHFAQKVCKTFRHCETPFTDEIVNALKKLAISIIPMAFLSSITNSVTDSMMTGNFNIMLDIDLMTIMLVVFVFMLAAIFKYGTILQIESDETL